MRNSLIILAVMGFSGCQPRKKEPLRPDDHTLTFAFYNVENLYDIEDDPRTNDQEFLPKGLKRWDERKYSKKIGDLSLALKALGGKELPEIIGLCEVENKKVVEDLVAHPNLAEGNYQVVHFHDRDSRGIDQALAYRSDEFSLESSRLIAVRKSGGGMHARGILYVSGRSNNGEMFHIFVNHWPSRENDEVSREQGRKDMAAALRKLSDDIQCRQRDGHVVIMGDMNDEPDNASLRDVLGATPPGQAGRSGLVNLMFPAMEKGHGSYKFQGDWKMLDNLVVSESLLDSTGYRVENNRGYVFSMPWMEEFRNSAGEMSPDRTYAGDKYTGGTSDHFPVYFRLFRPESR